MTTWPEARQAARDAAKPLEAVEVPLAEALGATLAEPLTANTPMPAFDTSAMDGYAVAGEPPWTLIGHVRAGGWVLPADSGRTTGSGAGSTAAHGEAPARSDRRVAALDLARRSRDAATGAHHPPADRSTGPTAEGRRVHPTAQPRTSLIDPAVGPRTSLGDLPASLDDFADCIPSTEHLILSPGQAVGIATGAPVPEGADAVLPVERSARVGMTVVGEVRAGQHVRRAGEDCEQGRELLPAGSVVSPTVLGLAAAVGHDVLRVHRRPRVAVVLTGDEVIREGTPGVGQVRDAIGPVLPGLLAAAGAELVEVVHVLDQAKPLVDALGDDRVDVLLVGGATSKGPADHLRAVLRDLRADVRVAGIECRPGHPQLLAVLPDGRCVVGLPGNPFAALAACVTLVEPLIGALAGRPARRRATAELREGVVAHPRDTRLVPVVVSDSAATPVGHDRPGTLWGAALANALAVVPPGWSGGAVEVLHLPG